MGVVRALLPHLVLTIATVYIIFASFDVWYQGHSTICGIHGCGGIERTGTQSKWVVPFGDGYLTASLGFAILVSSWSSLMFSSCRSALSATACLAGVAVMTIAGIHAFHSDPIPWEYPGDGYLTSTVRQMVAAGAAVALLAFMAIAAEERRQWLRALVDYAVPGRRIKPAR